MPHPFKKGHTLFREGKVNHIGTFVKTTVRKQNKVRYRVAVVSVTTEGGPKTEFWLLEKCRLAD